MDLAADIPKQDMPPPGGYSKIHYKRTFPKISMNWWKLASGLATLSVYGVCSHAFLQRKSWARVVEDQDIANALTPFMKAESDRMWLLMARRLRDEENEAMKDVPGWKTGTWYGEPIYFTVPRNKWQCPTELEVYAHSSREEYEHGKHFKRHVDVGNKPMWYDKYMPSVPWTNLV